MLFVIFAATNDVASQDSPTARSLTQLPGLTDTITGTDSLGTLTDPSPDAQECLTGLCWKPESFPIRFEAPDAFRGRLVVRFPSPLPSLVDGSDDVALEWYPARDEAGDATTARAVVVVHESGSGMTVGRILARGFHAQGLHAFLIHLPGYGRRKTSRPDSVADVLSRMKQGIADTRRARDVVSALPLVDSSSIGLQGTSLGGFVAATTAGLDQGYDRVFILLAGGNLHEVIMEGKRDAAKMRERLMAARLTADTILQLTRPIEPLRLAHRIRPASTWLYTGSFDDVVPPKCSAAFAAAANLEQSHHVQFPADHYSGIVFLPSIILDISQQLKAP
jgi:dienelactone hydrolase